jgi:hypothetical protein
MIKATGFNWTYGDTRHLIGRRMATTLCRWIITIKMRKII